MADRANALTPGPASVAPVRSRIRSIQVEGLFGVFFHRIELNLREHITVVHGPNGIGKTVILRMLHELLSGQVDMLAQVPFDQFAVEFVNGASLRVTQRRETKKSEQRPQVSSLVCKVSDGTSHEDVNLLEFMLAEDVGVRIARQLPGTWRYLSGTVKWQDMSDREVIGLADLKRRYTARLSNELIEQLPRLTRETNALMRQVSAAVETRLIKAERLKMPVADESPDPLYAAFYGRPARQRSSDVTAQHFASDLVRKIREVKTEYGAKSSNLDRSFVTRLLQNAFDVTGAEELIARFSALESQRKELASLGLLDSGGSGVIDEPGLATVRALLAQKGDVFSLYTDDMEAKLRVFDGLKAKLEVLRDRINRRFKYKTMEIDPEEGFSFLSHSGVRLNGSALSSGEQHVVILLYELLFVARPGDLVMIDEPELSLHIDWQMAFPDDLREAQRVSSIDILVATHSPAIAGAAPELLVPLMGPITNAEQSGGAH